jgi:hypothetical protein
LILPILLTRLGVHQIGFPAMLDGERGKAAALAQLGSRRSAAPAGGVVHSFHDPAGAFRAGAWSARQRPGSRFEIGVFMRGYRLKHVPWPRQRLADQCGLRAIPHSNAAPWPRLVDEARSRAYPGKEAASVNEAARAYRVIDGP